MAAPRRVIGLAIRKKELLQLRSIARSRMEAAARAARARMLLAYREDASFFAVGRAPGVHHQRVQRCVERAMTHGALAALDDSARLGREPVITVEERAWLVDLACRKSEHGPLAGHACLSDLVQGTVCEILDAEEVKPHKVRYYPERRDPDLPRRWRRYCASSRGQTAEEETAQRCRSDCLLRREAGRTGTRHDDPGLAA
jgi:hypothetical protein